MSGPAASIDLGESGHVPAPCSRACRHSRHSARSPPCRAPACAAKRLRHPGEFQFFEHRGFSLDLLHQGLRVIPLETVEQRTKGESRGRTIRWPAGRNRRERRQCAGSAGWPRSRRGTWPRSRAWTRPRIGDRVLIHSRDGAAGGEVLRLTRGRCYGPARRLGRRAGHRRPGRAARAGPRSRRTTAGSAGSSTRWASRWTDGRCCAGRSRAPLRAPAPAAADRRRLGERLGTGVAVFDTLSAAGARPADRLVRRLGRRQVLAAGQVRARGGGRCRGDRPGRRTRARAARIHRAGSGPGRHGAVGVS